ncbi:MAG: ROK family protein, partial [Microbacterium sp.]|uniref:ROK family protein n=1 Tax=Microbacterium sp. TaxID=51671 RepID=UPI003A8B05E2
EPLRPAYGPSLSYSDLLDVVDGGEPGPSRVLEDAGRAIAVPLAPVATFVNPSAVVVEAGSHHASMTVIEGIMSYLRHSMAPFIREALVLRPATLGASASDVGALVLARSRALGDPELSRRFAKLQLPLPLST